MRNDVLLSNKLRRQLLYSFLFVASFLLMTVAAGAQDDFHRLTLKAGAGVTPTVGDLSGVLNTGWNFTAGAGYRFNRAVSALGEFQYNGLGVDNSVLTQFKVPSGTAHVFSFTGNLRWEIKHDSKLSPYAIGGLGFYRRTVQFLQPTLAPAIFFDPFFGFVATGFIPADQIIGSVSRNGIGLNIGGGVSIKLGESGTRFFTEVRYHWAECTAETRPFCR